MSRLSRQSWGSHFPSHPRQYEAGPTWENISDSLPLAAHIEKKQHQLVGEAVRYVEQSLATRTHHQCQFELGTLLQQVFFNGLRWQHNYMSTPPMTSVVCTTFRGCHGTAQHCSSAGFVPALGASWTLRPHCDR